MDLLDGRRVRDEMRRASPGVTRIRSAARLGVTLIVVFSSRAASQVSIAHVNVVDVQSGTVQADRTVVIDGDRIRAITASPPAGTRAIDARGAYMIPGLWDMHVHLGMAGRSALALLVANGVTSVRDMGGEFDLVRSWRDSVRAGTLVGPRIEMTGPVVENARWLGAVRAMLTQSGDTVAARELDERIPVATPEEARAAVARVAALGVMLLKVRNDPPPDAYFALLAEARTRGIRVVGHTPQHVSLAQASDSGQASLEHELLGYANNRWVSTLDEMTAADRASLYARFVRNHTALVPTLVAGVGLRHTPDSVAIAMIEGTSVPADPRRRYLDPLLAREWRSQIEMKKMEGPQPDWVALHKLAAARLAGADSSGVLILAGTDLGTPLTYPGFAVHDELDLLVRDGGLSPRRALWAATLGPAQFFHLERDAGSIAPGKVADLVLLDANPLEDVRAVGRIRAVIRSGHYLDRAALDGMLASVAR